VYGGSQTGLAAGLRTKPLGGGSTEGGFAAAVLGLDDAAEAEAAAGVVGAALALEAAGGVPVGEAEETGRSSGVVTGLADDVLADDVVPPAEPVEGAAGDRGTDVGVKAGRSGEDERRRSAYAPRMTPIRAKTPEITTTAHVARSTVRGRFWSSPMPETRPPEVCACAKTAELLGTSLDP
jgi:hypothetical protein